METAEDIALIKGQIDLDEYYEIKKVKRIWSYQNRVLELLGNTSLSVNEAKALAKGGNNEDE